MRLMIYYMLINPYIYSQSLNMYIYIYPETYIKTC